MSFFPTSFQFADPSGMSEFKASTVAFEVQKNFANKFFSNKTVAKGLIDDKTATLLDNLYKLIFTFVSTPLVNNSSAVI